MLHFTMTGPYAGVPYCDVDKESAQQTGDTFQHVDYNRKGLEAQLTNPELCPACKQVYEDSDTPDPII